MIQSEGSTAQGLEHWYCETDESQTQELSEVLFPSDVCSRISSASFLSPVYTRSEDIRVGGAQEWKFSLILCLSLRVRGIWTFV